MSKRPQTCREAESDLVRVLEELRSRNILETPYRDMVKGAFERCPSCRKSRNGCLGWYLRLKGAAAVEFRHFQVRGNWLFVRLQGVFSTRRPKAARRLDAWQPQPCGVSSCAIEVCEVGSGKLVARHHHDLANVGQIGPVWHLQMGGAPAKDHRMDVPRWPVAPMDPVLVIELAVYSFFNETWKELSSINPWRNIIKRSEQLLLPHYRDRLNEYLTQGTGIDSWLAHQCNYMSGWDPRPA